MRVTYVAVAIALSALVGCSRKQETSQTPQADSAGAMGGMQMSIQGTQMMATMRAHLDSLASMSPAQMAAAMTAHQDLASRMMDAMGADMRGMGMQPDSAWAALADSVRVDLADLPGHAGPGLKQRMEVHIGRMRRLQAMHEGMMKM